MQLLLHITKLHAYTTAADLPVKLSNRPTGKEYRPMMTNECNIFSWIPGLIVSVFVVAEDERDPLIIIIFCTLGTIDPRVNS